MLADSCRVSAGQHWCSIGVGRRGRHRTASLQHPAARIHGQASVRDHGLGLARRHGNFRGGIPSESRGVFALSHRWSEYSCSICGQQLEDAKKLVCDAISAGVFNDLGSGSNVDLCVITLDRVDYLRPYKVANVKPVIQGSYVFPVGVTSVLSTKIDRLDVKESVTVVTSAGAGGAAGAAAAAAGTGDKMEVDE